MKIEIHSIYSIELVQQNPNKLFVFGENVKQQGSNVIGGGQAIIRGLPNTYGLCTLTAIGDYWTDEYFDVYKRQIDLDIKAICDLLPNELGTVVFPMSGLGTGRAKLHQKAPKTFLYLCGKLLSRFGYNNLGSLESLNF